MVAQCNHVFQANVVAFYVVPILIIMRQLPCSPQDAGSDFQSQVKFEYEAFINQWEKSRSIFLRNVLCGCLLS